MKSEQYSINESVRAVNRMFKIYLFLAVLTIGFSWSVVYSQVPSSEPSDHKEEPLNMLLDSEMVKTLRNAHLTKKLKELEPKIDTLQIEVEALKGEALLRASLEK
jgi:hypothetical protein